jgi:formylglycine-generating enzyme required for sulfatase activity
LSGFEGYTARLFLPPGTFTMGSPPNEMGRDSDEGPQTAVTLTRGFFIGKYEVTQGEYLAVIGSNPSHFTGDLNRPVERVSWFNATNYCGQLMAQGQAAGRLSTGWVCRLPTEAEWEYACRAGTTTRYSFGAIRATPNRPTCSQRHQGAASFFRRTTGSFRRARKIMAAMTKGL